MVVTAIRQTSSDRLIVTLDEAEEIKTTLGVVTEHRLYNGAELDDAAAEALRRDSARALARDRALGMVSRRMYSRKELRDKLVQLQMQAHAEKISDLKGVQMKIEWGSQIRSYVFMPYQLVKDNRTGYETSNINAVMDGDLDGFVTAYLTCAATNTWVTK